MNRQELVTALTAVKAGLAAKELIEQSTTFVFKDGRVITYNDEVSVSHKVDVDFEGAIPAKAFLAYLTKLKAEEIELTKSEDGSELQVKAKRAKSGFTLDAEIKLPFEEINIDDDAWLPLPKEFIQGLSFCRGIPSSDMSRPVLNCIHVNEGVMEATDSFRVVDYKWSDTDEEMPQMLIPQYTLAHIILMKPTFIQVVGEWAHFKNKMGTELSCRLLEGEFPSISKFFFEDGTEIPLPTALADTLEKASIFTDGLTDVDNYVDLEMKKGKLKVSSKSDEGWFEETLKNKYKGEIIDFQIARYLLQEIIKETKSFQFNGSLLLFVKDNWRYVTTTRIGE